MNRLRTPKKKYKKTHQILDTNLVHPSKKCSNRKHRKRTKKISATLINRTVQKTTNRPKPTSVLRRMRNAPSVRRYRLCFGLPLLVYQEPAWVARRERAPLDARPDILHGTRPNSVKSGWQRRTWSRRWAQWSSCHFRLGRNGRFDDVAIWCVAELMFLWRLMLRNKIVCWCVFILHKIICFLFYDGLRSFILYE